MKKPQKKSWRASRWFRLEVKFPENGDILDPVPQAGDINAESLIDFFCPNGIELLNQASARRLSAIGKCIYCGAVEFAPNTGASLSEEHIVSEGLGARLILPEASCQACSDKTKKIEGAILRELLWAPRKNLGIRRKKRKRHENAFPITIIAGDKEISLNLPIEIHPTMLFLPVLNAPGVIVNRAIGESGIQGFLALELNNFNAAARMGLRHFTSSSFDSVRFSQLLAKIAHGYAVLVFGIDGFNPLLNGFILESFSDKLKKWPEIYHLIGGDPTDYTPSEALHVLGWGALKPDNDETIYLTIVIRLFANLGAPVYHVIVGTPSDTLPIVLDQSRE